MLSNKSVTSKGKKRKKAQPRIYYILNSSLAKITKHVAQSIVSKQICCSFSTAARERNACV